MEKGDEAVDLEKKKEFIINFTYFIIILGIILVTFQHGIFLVMPFIIALLVASLLQPIIWWVYHRVPIKRGLIAIVLVLLFYTIVGSLLTLLIIQLCISLKGVFVELPNIYIKEIEPMLMGIMDKIADTVIDRDPTLVFAVDEVLSNFVLSLSGVISGMSVKVVGLVSMYATAIPGRFIEMLITIISTFFITIDYDNLVGFLMRQLPNNKGELVRRVKTNVIQTLVKYILSYGFILSVTCMELAIGFWILKVEHSLLIAFIIAIFDILPVVGTGGIMIPWALIMVLSGNYGLGIGLFALYIFITVVRNILEPKVIGKQVGLHPVVTLVSMFVGASLFGVIGLFGVPITITLIKKLNDEGTIQLFK